MEKRTKGAKEVWMSDDTSDSPLPSYQIVSKTGNLVVAVKDGGIVEGSELVLAQDSGALDQCWTVRAFNGEVLVENARSFLYIAVLSDGKDPDAPLVLQSAKVKSAKWRLGGEYEARQIDNMNSQLCISVRDSTPISGGRLVQRQYEAADDQAWLVRLVKTVRVSVGATINGAPTVFCDPLVVKMPRHETGILLSFVLDHEFRSDWKFPEAMGDDCFYGITIANGLGTEFVEPRRTGDHRVVVVDRNRNEQRTRYPYMVTLKNIHNNMLIFSDDPTIENRNDG
jgi:hypothetical protein